MHPSCKTNGKYLLSKGPRNPADYSPQDPKSSWQSSHPWIPLSFFSEKSFAIIGEVLLNEADVSSITITWKLLSRSSLTIEGRGGNGAGTGWQWGSSEKATPGLLRQAPGVAFSFKGCEPSLTVQCEDPQPFAVPLPWRPWPISRGECTTTWVKYSHSAVSSINHVLISLFTTYHSELSIKGNFVYLEMVYQLLFIHTRCFIRLREKAA